MPNRKFIATLCSIGAVAGCGLTSDHAGSTFEAGESTAFADTSDTLPDAPPSEITPSSKDFFAESSSPGSTPKEQQSNTTQSATTFTSSTARAPADPDSAPSEPDGIENSAFDEDESADTDDAVIIGEARVCEKSWEEAPGTADYTTFNNYLRSIGRKRRTRVDREESSALRGSEAFASMNVCERARALKPCFEKVTLRGEDWGARRFRDWARREKLNPVRAHLAFALQETYFGKFEDSCRRGVCYGIGMLQIISAFDDEGRSVASGAPEWDGITHNILTNIKYSARVLAVKIDFGAKSLSQLAYYYNGNPSLQSHYARKVLEHYRDLKRCQI